MKMLEGAASGDKHMRPMAWNEAAADRQPLPTGAGRAHRAGGRHSGLIRLCDVLISGIALVAVGPVLILVALLIRATAPGPVFFSQRRVGAGGHLFDCYKFRTMAIDAEARLQHLLQSDPAARHEWESCHKLRDDPRIVGVGRFLRKSSLDELPQLWNVLRGDMSLVGPRPIVMAEVPRYGRHFAAYCTMRPGITGLWQISGRNLCSYRRRVAYDVRFCRTASIGLYWRILLLTIPSVLTNPGS